MTTLKRFLSMLAVLAVAGCGGGGGSAGCSTFTPDCSTPTPTATTVTDLDVKLSAPTIPNSGTGSVTATVTALDANRNAVPGAAVTMSSDSGLLTVSGTTGSVTDATGKLVATVTLGANLAPRNIVVTATSGSIRRTANLQVVDSPAGAVATSIEVTASDTQVGTGGDTVLISAFVKDANNNALPSTAISFRTNTGTLSGAGTSTDATGLARATFSAGSDKSNRTAVVTVSSGSITTQLSLPIAGTKLALSGPTSLIVGNSAIFDVVVRDSNSNVVPNVAVTARSSLNNPLTPAGGAVTDGGGLIRFNYTATNAGADTLVFTGAGATVSPSNPLTISAQDFSFVSPAPSESVTVNSAQPIQVRLRSGGAPLAGQTVSFAATGGTLTTSSALTDAAGLASTSLTSSSAGPVTVQATVTVGANTTSITLPLNIVAKVPAKLVLQINPTAIAPNADGTTSNQAQVSAKVTDSAGNPVKDVVVNFSRVIDPSGGNLLQASAPTNANGVALATYRAGAESTANNGVILSGTVANSSPAISGTASLTVNQTALFIALGTGNTITNVDPQTYKKDWVVYVTDSNGVAVDGVTLTIKAIPTFYRTGRLIWDGTVWAYLGPIYSCRTEDKNNNGILDASEDDNLDGVLWPGNVISVAPSTVITTNGRAPLSLIYAESYVPWVQLRLTASATVSGTESRTDAEFIIDGLGTDFSNQNIPPAGVFSPFGLLPKRLPAMTSVQPGDTAPACTLVN